MMILFGLLVCFIGFVSSQEAGFPRGEEKEFLCPHKRGNRITYHPDDFQCDKYYVCEPGEQFGRIDYCDDGLVFNNATAPRLLQCEYTFNVERECLEEDLQLPQSTEFCYRRNGLFRHENPANCREYYECVGGEPHLRKCHDKLVFYEPTGKCEWETEKLRAGCEEQIEELDGFQCPKKPVFIAGVKQVTSYHGAPDDCRYFYSCSQQEGIRRLGCSEGNLFNDETKICEAAENVPCTQLEDYYLDGGDYVDDTASLTRTR